MAVVGLLAAGSKVDTAQNVLSIHANFIISIHLDIKASDFKTVFNNAIHRLDSSSAKPPATPSLTFKNEIVNKSI